MNPSASKCRNRAASRWVSPTVQSSSSRTSTCATVSCAPGACRSEEHTSELQSQSNLVCRLLLEKKKQNLTTHLIRSFAEPAYIPATAGASTAFLPSTTAGRCSVSASCQTGQRGTLFAHPMLKQI